jgi:uncharacterized glyoxalase superfamily metalloenzyme YdcJ
MISTSERTDVVSLAALRTAFALRLADLYGTEVPAYNTLVEVSREVNSDVATTRGGQAERLGSIDRVTAERHGAIRVGSPRELAEAARVFAGFGMHPVGFYDLRGASKSSVPVVPEPIVYEDFLPRSAAGIFQSNLTDEGTRDDEEPGTPYDIDTLSAVIGRPIADPTELYAAQQQASLTAAARALGLRTITLD